MKKAEVTKLSTIMAAAILSIVPLEEAKSQSQPPGKVLSYTYDGQAPVKVNFNTNLFWIEEDGTLHITSEAMTAIDKNHQTLNGSHDLAAFASEPSRDKRNEMGAQNKAIYIEHLSDQHMECILQSMSLAVAMAKSRGEDPINALNNAKALYEQLYPEQIKAAGGFKAFAKGTPCSLENIDNLVKEKLGL